MLLKRSLYLAPIVALLLLSPASALPMTNTVMESLPGTPSTLVSSHGLSEKPSRRPSIVSMAPTTAKTTQATTSSLWDRAVGIVRNVAASAYSFIPPNPHTIKGERAGAQISEVRDVYREKWSEMEESIIVLARQQALVREKQALVREKVAAGKLYVDVIVKILKEKMDTWKDEHVGLPTSLINDFDFFRRSIIATLFPAALKRRLSADKTGRSTETLLSSRNSPAKPTALSTRTEADFESSFKVEINRFLDSFAYHLPNRLTLETSAHISQTLFRELDTLRRKLKADVEEGSKAIFQRENATPSVVEGSVRRGSSSIRHSSK